MDIIPLIRKVSEIATSKYDEISTPVYGKRGKSMITLLSQVTEDHEIWGGLGDRTSYCNLGFDENGLFIYYFTTETGQYQKGDCIVYKSESNITENRLIEYINGENCDDEDRMRFIKNCNDIIAKYASL